MKLMQYFVCQNQSTLNDWCAFICRIERLQDFARQFSQVTSVTNSETHNASPNNKRQKRVCDKNSPKMVSNEILFSYNTVLLWQHQEFIHLVWNKSVSNHQETFSTEHHSLFHSLSKYSNFDIQGCDNIYFCREIKHFAGTCCLCLQDWGLQPQHCVGTQECMVSSLEGYIWNSHHHGNL